MYHKNITVGLTVALIAISLFAILLASGVFVTSQTFKTTGILATANLGLYSDSACTQGLTSVNWGTISPGASISRTIYLKNIGNAQMTLHLSVTNWSPATANGPIAISWNRESAILSAGQVISATVVLTVSASASGFTSFNVDVMITGTG